MKRYLMLYAILPVAVCCGCDSRNSPSWHWKQIERYNAYIRDPNNLKEDQSSSYIDDVPDIMPSLYALHKAGEITHLDLVFPNVPQTREVTRYWMAYCEKDADIIYATGNPSYAEFQTSGVQPVHLNIWFKPIAKERVKELINAMEESGKK